MQNTMVITQTSSYICSNLIDVFTHQWVVCADSGGTPSDYAITTFLVWDCYVQGLT